MGLQVGDGCLGLTRASSSELRRWFKGCWVYITKGVLEAKGRLVHQGFELFCEPAGVLGSSSGREEEMGSRRGGRDLKELAMLSVC